MFIFYNSYWIVLVIIAKNNSKFVNEPFKISIGPELDFYVRRPLGLLSNFVSMIWASKGVPNFLEERVIPDGGSLLLFNFGTPLKSFNTHEKLVIKSCVFVGVFTSFSSISYPPDDSIHQQVGIIFNPGGAYPFVKTSMDEFKNLVVDATLLNKNLYGEIYQRLGEISSCNDRIILLETILNDLLKQHWEPALSWDFIKLIKNRTDLNTEKIIVKTGYSHQYVNKIMRQQVGINVKGLQNIFKDTQALEVLKKQNNEANYASIAQNLNYYDQAHFIHCIKKMTGFTPKELKLLQQPTTARIFYL